MNFLDVLKEQIVVLDGATGTAIQDLHLGDESFGGSDYKMLSDLLSFSRPDDMRQIHINYYKAGSHAVETNTFARPNPTWLLPRTRTG